MLELRVEEADRETRLPVLVDFVRDTVAVGLGVDEVSVEGRDGRVGQIVEEHVESDELAHALDARTAPRDAHEAVGARLVVARKVHCLLGVVRQRRNRTVKDRLGQSQTIASLFVYIWQNNCCLNDLLRCCCQITYLLVHQENSK